MKQRGVGGGGERMIGDNAGNSADGKGSKSYNEGVNPISRETRENKSFSTAFSRNSGNSWSSNSSNGRGRGRGGGESRGRGRGRGGGGRGSGDYRR